jgi:hypothetical protein
MEISTSPLQNKDTVSNYIINALSYKDIVGVLPEIEKMIGTKSPKTIDNFNQLKNTKNIKFLGDILSDTDTETSLNVGYLILKNSSKHEMLSEDGNYVFMYKKSSSKEFEIVLLDNSRKIYVGNLILLKINNSQINKLFDSNQIYQVSYISLDQRLTGQGLGGTFYKLIYELENVDVLLSSDNLYKGSFSVWSKTLKNIGKYHGIIVNGTKNLFLSPFNSLNTTPFNEPSIESFFISKKLNSSAEKTYNNMSTYENKQVLFYYTPKDISVVFNTLKPLENVTLSLNQFNDLVNGELDSEIDKLNINYKTYDFTLNLINQNIDVVDNNVTNVCVFGKNGQVNLAQENKKIKVNIL